MIAALIRRAEEWSEGQSVDPLDYALAWQADGKTLRQLAVALSLDIGLEVARQSLCAYLYELAGSEREPELALARARGAHALADETLDDAACATPSNSHAVRLGIGAKQWLAERWNRAEYGKAPEVAISISAKDLHLAALRAPQVPPLPPPTRVLPSPVMPDAIDITDLPTTLVTPSNTTT